MAIKNVKAQVKAVAEGNPMDVGLSEVVQVPPKTEEKRVAKAERIENITVGIDRTDDVILQLNLDKGVQLEWDELSFRKLPAAIVEQLRPANMKAYLIAETKAEEHARRVAKLELPKNPLSPLSGYSEARERIRARAGWHQCWANAGRDFDDKMRGPYKQVRKQKDGENQPAGEENGEVLKRLDGEGKVEAIALECPEHLYLKYLEWMSSQSGVRKTGVKSDFFAAVEGINRELPRDQRILPIDDEGELQA